MVDRQRYADFVRISSDWLWETDVAGRFTYFSVEQSSDGFDLGFWLGRRRADFAVREPENQARLDAIEAEVEARRPFRDMVYRGMAGDHPRWCLISGEPVYDDAGAFAGYRGVGRDITGLIEMQQQLRDKSAILDAVLEAMPDGVQVLDGKGVTRAFNRQLQEIMDIEGRRTPTTIASMYDDLLELARRGEYGPGDPEALAAARVEQLKSLMAHGTSYTYRRETTAGRWFEGRLRPLAGGGLLMLYRDITEDRRRERELERQSFLLSAIVENMADGISVFDNSNQLILWNKHFPQLVGIPPERLQRGSRARDLLAVQASAGEFGPGDPEDIARRWMKDVGRNPTVVYERTRPDGRVVEVRRHGISDGGAVSIYIDVTERKKAEQELKALNATLEQRISERTAELADSERTLRSLVSNIPGMVYRCRNDRDWTMLFVSDGCRDLLGVEPRHLTSGAITFGSLIHPDDRAVVWEKVQADFARSDSFELEYRLRDTNGTWKWVWDRADAIRDAEGKAIGLEGLVLDIDDRKRAETAARQARFHLLDTIESVNTGLLLYDAEGRLLLFNKQLLDQYPDDRDLFVAGRTFEEIFRAVVERGRVAVPAGKTVDDVVRERLDQLMKADGRVLERRLPDGRVLHVSEHRTRSGGIVSIGHDVTDRVSMEEKLRQAQRMEAIGQLTGGLAHDLNNYLAVIMGNLDLLTDHVGGEADAMALVAGALAGARRGAELTRSLLAFSRRQPLDPKVLDVGRRIRQLAELLRRTIGERVAVGIEVTEDLWPVKIDGAQLDSALVNLVNNARDAMPDGGAISISARNVAGGEGDRILIEVSDTGVGMDAHVKARAFEPFFSTKDIGHGTGLGLSMVHGFVHQSDGTVMLDSTPGRGTVVRLYLPRSAETAAAFDEGDEPGATRGTGTILVAEDNEFVRATVAAQLKSLGYEVVEADSGDAALRLMEEAPGGFRLLLTDIVMPGRLDGNALARLTATRWPETRIILTSGYAGDATSPDVTRAAFLRKPYRMKELAEAVTNALRD